MKEKEVWKVWHNGPRVIWEVSDQGRVKKNGTLYECRLCNGYKFLGHHYSVHRAVAMLFIPNPENKPCVDHINTNPLDNRACNLRWVTPKENSNNPLTLKHMSESLKGKPQSEESNRKRSESLKGKNNPMYGVQSPNKGKHKVWDNKELNKYHYE